MIFGGCFVSKNVSNNHIDGNILMFNPSGEFFFSKGIAAFERNDLVKAKKYLARAWKFEPTEPIIACQLAIVLTEMGEYDSSNKILLKVLSEIDPYMVECHYFLANNYAYIGNYMEAKKHVKQYLKSAPNGEYTSDAQELLEIISLEADEIKTTCLTENHMEYEDELIERQEHSRKLMEDGDFDGAVPLLEQMIREYPNFWPAFNNLALAYFYQGKSKESVEILQRVLEENPGNLHALCNLSVLDFYKGKNVKPLLDILKKVYPISVDHRYKLGVTLLILEQYELGYHWLKKILHDGNEVEGIFYYWFAYAAYKMGKMNLAEKAWKKLLLEHPEKDGQEPWKHEEIPMFTK